MTLSILAMTKRPMKKSKRGYLWGVEEPAAGGGGDNESAVDPGPAAEGQSFLGRYPVTKALSTFENLTFRKLRGTVQADRPPMV